LHELIIKKASGKFSPINVSSQNHYGVAISLKLLFGALSQAKLEQPLLFEGTTLTRKMGFPDVIMPGETELVHMHIFHIILIKQFFFLRGCPQ
jgi:dedicator of cytokinesis protein 3